LINPKLPCMLMLIYLYGVCLYSFDLISDQNLKLTTSEATKGIEKNEFQKSSRGKLRAKSSKKQNFPCILLALKEISQDIPSTLSKRHRKNLLKRGQQLQSNKP